MFPSWLLTYRVGWVCAPVTIVAPPLAPSKIAFRDCLCRTLHDKSPRAYSFVRGAIRRRRRLVALSKAILATAERPEPSVPTTTPSPRVACMTRSPTVSDSVGASSSAEDAFPEPPLEEDLADVSTPNPPGLDPFEPRPVEPAPLKLPRLPEAPPLKLPRLPAPPRLPEPPRPPEPPRLPEPHDPEVPDPMIGPPSSSP